MTELQHHHNVVWRCTDHVVWCPTYRRPVLVSAVGTRLTGLLEDIAAERAITIREREVMPDHGHLLLDVEPQVGIHRAVQWMKGRSSRVLRTECPARRSRLPTVWTNS